MEPSGEIEQCNVLMQVVMYPFAYLFNYQAFLFLSEFWCERRYQNCLVDQV